VGFTLAQGLGIAFHSTEPLFKCMIQVHSSGAKPGYCFPFNPLWPPVCFSLQTLKSDASASSLARYASAFRLERDASAS